MPGAADMYQWPPIDVAEDAGKLSRCFSFRLITCLIDRDEISAFAPASTLETAADVTEMIGEMTESIMIAVGQEIRLNSLLAERMSSPRS